MRRSTFLVGVSALVAPAGVPSISIAENSADPLLERFRGGDFAATPFARTAANAGSISAAPVHAVLSAVRTGSVAELIDILYSTDGMTARLYRIPFERFPMACLLVGTPHALTDVAAFPITPDSAPARPSISPDRVSKTTLVERF